MTPARIDRNALDVLTERGFVQDVTDADALRDLFENERVTFYVGFDPTSSSLHIGNLVGMMAMAWMQRCGHRPIALAGGGTGRVGDPSFRDDERELLDESTIAANLASIRDQLGRLLVLDTPEDGLLLDNHTWLGGFGFLEFIRDVGKHFSVNQMINKESVRRRLTERDQGISFTEFSYQLLQAYDFAHLHDTEGCRLQGGGSDQWGNITAGIDLTRRLHGGQVFGLVWPLVERSDGAKMSKSAGDEAIWLSADETSPYTYYQWFFNVANADVGRFLRIYTFLPLDEIAALEEAVADDPAGRAAQRALATEATRIMHGDDGLARAERATAVLFGDEPFAGLDDQTLADAFDAAPSVDLPRSRLDDGVGLLELMVEVGAADSNGAARRLVSQGGVQLNNVAVDDPALRLDAGHLASSTLVVLRVGKKRYYLARFR